MLTPNPSWLDGVDYNEDTRVHLVDGEHCDSVTQVLKLAGLSSDFANVPKDVLARAGARGQAAHAAAHYYDEGDLVESSVAADVQPRLEAWKWFRTQRAFRPVLLETVVVSRRHKFIGRIDRLGWCEARLVLLDLKCGDPRAARADLQTAAYLIALEEQYPELANFDVARWAIELRPNGKYAIQPYPTRGRTSRMDRADFIAAVDAARRGAIAC